MSRIVDVLMASGIILRSAVFMAVLCTVPVWAGTDSGGNPRGLATDANFQSINPSTDPGEPATIKPAATAPIDDPGLLDADSNGVGDEWEQQPSDSEATTPFYGWDSDGGSHFMEYLAGAAAVLAIYLPILLWHITRPRPEQEARSTRSRSRRKRRSSRSRVRPANFETSRRD